MEHGGTPMGHHVAWKASLGASVGPDDPIVHMHAEFSKLMQTMCTYDQLDGANLACGELVARQLQLCEEKYKDKILAQRGGGGLQQDEGYFFTDMGSTRGIMVSPELTKWVAGRLQAESSIAKERRKAREERQLAAPSGGGGAGGGGGGPGAGGGKKGKT